MANIASARKRARQAVVRNAHNSSLHSSLRTAIKSVRKAIAAGDKAVAAQSLQSCQSVVAASPTSASSIRMPPRVTRPVWPLPSRQWRNHAMSG
jgi:ribosomal protein S20